MLKLNIEKHCRLRNITRPIVFLHSAGFAYHTASRISRGEHTKFSLADLEKLCLAFKCTPNDLLEWTPEKKDEKADAHPLAELRAQEVSSIAFKEASYKELKKYSEELKKS